LVAHQRGQVEVRGGRRLRVVERPVEERRLVALFQERRLGAARGAGGNEQQRGDHLPSGCCSRNSAIRDRSTSCWAPVPSSLSFPLPDFTSASPSTSAKRARRASARLSWFPGLERRNDTSAYRPRARSDWASLSAKRASSSPSGAMNSAGRDAVSVPA